MKEIEYSSLYTPQPVDRKSNTSRRVCYVRVAIRNKKKIRQKGKRKHVRAGSIVLYCAEVTYNVVFPGLLDSSLLSCFIQEIEVGDDEKMCFRGVLDLSLKSY